MPSHSALPQRVVGRVFDCGESSGPVSDGRGSLLAASARFTGISTLSLLSIDTTIFEEAVLVVIRIYAS